MKLCRNALIAATALMVLVASCSPKPYLPKPKEYLGNVKGSYIQTISKGRPQKVHEGEIIAVERDYLLIISVSRWDTTTVVLRENVLSAYIQLASTSDDPGKINTWAGLMNIMTLAHGYFMIFTVPINLIASISTASGAANSTYRIEYPQEIKWEEIRKFSRFPQGMPHGVTMRDLQ